MFKRYWLFLWVILALIFPTNVRAQGDAPLVLWLTAGGPVTPAMAEYLARGIAVAERRGAEALIFQLNTPGGAIDLTTKIVETIRASQVPVIVYVAPNGAMAASAGTLITLAGHVAAMAPETAIGAASPVGPEGAELGETIKAKEINILKAYVRSLAERRGPEVVALAEATIETAQAVSAGQALEVGMVDFVSSDVYDLLRQADGFVVDVAGSERALSTADPFVETFRSSLIEQLLAALTNPNIVLILLGLGVQAILIEISSPGGWVAGFIGVVCLALAGYGLGILPVNWFGIIFLVLAFALFILDIKAPTHGALTAAGVTSFIVGALVLFNSPGVPSFQRVSVPLVIGMALSTGVIFFIILTFGLRAQKAPIQTGQESLVGRRGAARSALDPAGIVHLGGEEWSAEVLPGEEPVARGERVEVVEVQGLKLLVRRIEE